MVADIFSHWNLLNSHIRSRSAPVYIIDFFFYQSANSSWMRVYFSLPCHILFDILLKYSSQYSKSIVFSWWKLSIHFSKILTSVTFYHTVMVVISLKKQIPTFLFLWLSHCQEKQKFKLHSFLCRFQALNPNSIQCLRFINCFGKVNNKSISWHVKHDWTLIGY